MASKFHKCKSLWLKWGENDNEQFDLYNDLL